MNLVAEFKEFERLPLKIVSNVSRFKPALNCENCLFIGISIYICVYQRFVYIFKQINEAKKTPIISRKLCFNCVIVFSQQFLNIDLLVV